MFFTWLRKLTLFLSGLGITGGITNYGGGGISNGGNLDLSEVEIYGNRAYKEGGGVYNFGTLSVSDSTIDGNLASYGSGIYIRYFGFLTMVDCVVTGNSAGSSGGGIYNSEGTVEIQSSLISGNTANHWNGGGVKNHLGTLSITNSTIAGNSASNCAGIENNGTLSVANSTISHNVAEHEGGGLNNRGDNTSTLINTVIAGNSASGFVDFNGGLTAESSHNFIGTEDGNPMLTAIADAEGVIRYYIPQLGSPLIDAGDDAQAVAAGLTVDVRGKERFVGTVDIGAVEFQGTPGLAVSPSPFVEVIEGQSGSFLVCLTADPMGTVEVSVEKLAGGSDVTSVDQSALTFDSGNWNVPQSVSVLAGNDSNLCEDSDIYALSCTGMDTVHLTVTSIDTMIQTYLVNSLEDTVALDGKLTLREVIVAANTNEACGDASGGSEFNTDVIRFDPALFDSGPAMISMVGGEFVISEKLVIEGPDDDLLSIDGSGTSRVFNIESEATVTLEGVTVSGGFASSGAGISNRGTLLATNLTICNNSADTGGGIYNRGTLHLSDSRVLQNNAVGSGGGVNSYGALLVTGVEFEGNTAEYGGGVRTGGASVSFDDVVFLNNQANQRGGGIYLTGSANKIVVANSSFYANSASTGAGIFSADTSVDVANSVFSGNVATIGGGAIWFYRGSGRIANSTLAGNEAGYAADIFKCIVSLTMTNTISAFNLDTNSPPDDMPLTPESGCNLIGMDPIFVRKPSPGDDGIWGTSDDDFGNLHLQEGSPAIDTGSNALAVDAGGDPLLTDLEGNPRIHNGTVDIGAYEAGSAAPAVVQVKIDDGTQRSCVRSLWVNFSESVTGVAIESLRLTNLSTGETISINAMALPATTSPSVHHWTFPGFLGGRLPDGNYLAEILAEGVVDADGAAMAEDYSFEFHSFFGDSDGDRDVDIADLFRFRKTYRRTVFDDGFDGRFDSDSDGDVDLADLFAFRQNYKETLPAPVAIEGGIEGWSLPVSIPIFMNSSFTTIPERIYGPVQRSEMKIGEPVSLKPVDFHAFSPTPAVAPSLAEEPFTEASIDEGLLTTLAIDLQQSRSTSKKNEEEASEDSPFALVYQWLD